MADNLKDTILGAIKEGHTKMRPRWHFVAERAFIGAGAVLLLLALLYLASFMVFALRESGAWFAPQFGSRGWLTFLRSLPWVLILLSVGFIVALEALVRKYQFAYRTPLLYSLVGVVLLVALGGLIAAPLHRGPFAAAWRDALPGFVGKWYRQFGMPHMRDIHRGMVRRIMPEGFVVEDARGATSSVMLRQWRGRPFYPPFREGDRVFIFGDAASSGIEAYGVEQVEE
ncbi:MAG: hypothetical protein HYW65_04700 [Candidatus Liptonbacteria bacterium]|nr:hypothetical protein [Candidatus Liptonbacteria bacterium]